MSRKRRLQNGIVLAVLWGVVGSQMACGVDSGGQGNAGSEILSQQGQGENSDKENVTEQVGDIQGEETSEEEEQYYEKDGFLAERTDLVNDRMLEKAGKHFTTLYESYLKPNGIKPYFSIIPDKNYYLTGTEKMKTDFDEMVDRLCGQCEFMQYIDIREKLDVEDYYYTDSHWKQECIQDVAEYLCGEMGNSFQAEYETRLLDTLFKGSYYKEIETGIEPDQVSYLTNDMLEQCKVSKYEGMEPEKAELYDMKKAAGDNPYDIFLGGAVPIVTVENTQVENGKKLILFRDSYGSSIAPLFVSGYQTVTLVDIRYIQSGLVGQFVDFTDADVLFLYSSILLNNSAGMK